MMKASTKPKAGHETRAFFSAAILARAAAVLGLALAAGGAVGENTKPQYGGTFDVITVFPTLTALSWDPADWVWKNNHDTGSYYEELFSGDLDKSVRKGGKYKFFFDGWLPSAAIRGE